MTIYFAVLATLAVVGLWMVVAALYEIHQTLRKACGEPPPSQAESAAKRVRMPWEGDETTFNVVKKRMHDDGMG